MKNKLAVHQILVLVTTLAVIVINVLANALPINGLDTGEISDSFDIYFVPAGYVFSIWGLIYLGLLGYTIYQALPEQRENTTLKRIAPYYVLSGVANIGWIFMWHYEQFLFTLPFMLIIFVTLLLIWFTIRANTEADGSAFNWLVRVPFSLYIGWISVATVANATQLLYFLEWGGWGISPETWAVIMLIVAAAIASLMLLRERDMVYIAVFIWAYVGIQVKHSDTPVVGLTALILATVMAVLLVLKALNVFPKRDSLAKPGARAA